MRKDVFVLAAALLLVSCGTDIETASVNKAVTTTAATTTGVTSSVTQTTTAAESSAAVPEEKEQEPVLKYNNEIEVFSKATLSEIVTETNAKLLEPDMLIDTSEIGEKKITAKVSLDGRETETELTVNIVDKTPPVLLTGDYITVAQGSANDLSGFGAYADNCDPYPTLSVNGSVDTSSPGTYSVDITLSDSSGNSDTRTVTVEVAGQVSSFIQPDNGTMTFADYRARYGDNVGIDVSAWQGSIDFQSVASEGCRFAMVRAGRCTGGLYVDDYFLTNVDNANEAGIDCGVYFYSSDNDPDEVREHARWVVNSLNGRKLSMPIAFDWEDFGNFRSYAMSLHDLNDLYKAFREEVEAAGYDAMLYGSKNFLNSAWDTDGENVWLAHYVDQTDYSGQYSLWQTGIGRISGIDADVDLNVRY